MIGVNVTFLFVILSVEFVFLIDFYSQKTSLYIDYNVRLKFTINLLEDLTKYENLAISKNKTITAT